jgi:hypothetical protein
MKPSKRRRVRAIRTTNFHDNTVGKSLWSTRRSDPFLPQLDSSLQTSRLRRGTCVNDVFLWWVLPSHQTIDVDGGADSASHPGAEITVTLIVWQRSFLKIRKRTLAGPKEYRPVHFRRSLPGPAKSFASVQKEREPKRRGPTLESPAFVLPWHRRCQVLRMDAPNRTTLNN